MYIQSGKLVGKIDSSKNALPNAIFNFKNCKINKDKKPSWHDLYELYI